MNSEMNTDKSGLKEKFREEMRIYAWLSLYLFVSFAVLLMFESSVGGGNDPSTVHYSVALVKALVIGKFILIGKALGVGERATASNLVHRVALRVLAFAVVLVVFKVLEELIVGWVHGESAATVLSGFADKGWMAIASPILIMILLLIPLAAFVELERAIGAEKLADLVKGEN